MTRDTRCQIYALKANGNSYHSIAKQLNVHVSTISREIKRNTGNKGYRYSQADQKAKKRRKEASCKLKKMTPHLKDRIKENLEKGWSPEQISGRFKEEGLGAVSHETIYKFVYKDKKEGGDLYKNLRHFGKKYNKRKSKNAGRGLIPNRVDISLRPKIVERKERLGDFEGDTIIGAKHQGALLTHVDKNSKYTLITKLDYKRAELVVDAIKQSFKKIPHKIHTITYDNGKEFSSHEQIKASTGADIYFATPYHSWERGLNEHTNGLIRQYLPKSTDLSKVTPEAVQTIQDRLNHRPRKVLNFKTPHEVFILGLKTDDTVALHC
jgi:IS30 family transposase